MEDELDQSQEPQPIRVENKGRGLGRGWWAKTELKVNG